MSSLLREYTERLRVLEWIMRQINIKLAKFDDCGAARPQYLVQSHRNTCQQIAAYTKAIHQLTPNKRQPHGRQQYQQHGKRSLVPNPSSSHASHGRGRHAGLYRPHRWPDDGNK